MKIEHKLEMSETGYSSLMSEAGTQVMFLTKCLKGTNLAITYFSRMDFSESFSKE